VDSLLDAAVSGLVGHPVRTLPEPRFTTENGTALLEEVFSDVTLHARDTILAFPAAQPVTGYLGSVREPIELVIWCAAARVVGHRLVGRVHMHSWACRAPEMQARH
jgi:hypothetical protein